MNNIIVKCKIAALIVVVVGGLSCASGLSASEVDNRTFSDINVRNRIDMLFYYNSEHLFFGLANISHQDKIVTNYFVYGSVKGMPVTIEMTLFDHKGKEYNYYPRINAGCPDESEYRVLKPGELIGISWPLNGLVVNYKLKSKQKYKVRLQYHIDKGCTRARSKLSFVESDVFWYELVVP